MNLLTGHLGYIGSHLVEYLSGDWQFCDLKDGNDYRDISGQSFDRVIHLAAFVSVTESFENPDSYFSNNALGVRDFCLKNQIGRMIFASTGGAMYGDKILARECDPTRPVSPYALSKLRAEYFASQIPRHAILRFANVFGGDYSVRGEAAVHAHFAADDPIVVYGGSQTRDFIHIEKVCQAIIRSLDLGRGIYNIGSGEQTPIMGLACQYALDRKVSLKLMPKRDGEIEHISLDCSRARRDGLL